MSGIAIFGITGRMGQTLVRALGERGAAQPLRLVGALASPLSVRLGSDAAAGPAPTGVVITADPRTALKDAVVALDFSLPQCVGDNARACMAARVPLLVGATGFDGATREVLKAVAAVIPVLVAPNTSVGVNLVARLVKLATRALGPGYDVEISEAHHRTKRDAPSGTALALGEAVAAERGRKLADIAVFDRHGSDARRRAGDIGFAVLR